MTEIECSYLTSNNRMELFE